MERLPVVRCQRLFFFFEPRYRRVRALRRASSSTYLSPYLISLARKRTVFIRYSPLFGEQQRDNIIRGGGKETEENRMRNRM